jgi:hypothetical protein
VAERSPQPFGVNDEFLKAKSPHVLPGEPGPEGNRKRRHAGHRPHRFVRPAFPTFPDRAVEDPVRNGVHGKDRVFEHRPPERANLPLERLPLAGTRRLDHADGLFANDYRISREQIRRGMPGRNQGKEDQEEETEIRPRPPGSVGKP